MTKENLSKHEFTIDLLEGIKNDYKREIDRALDDYNDSGKFMDRKYAGLLSKELMDIEDSLIVLKNSSKFIKENEYD